MRDLTGQTAYTRRREQFQRGIGVREGLIVNAVLWAALAVAGYWWLYPALWLLPLATWYQLVSRIRNIAEHAVVPDNDDPLRNTRTTYANPLIRLLVAPYWVNYHLEHHLFMFVPCWRLPQAHRALLAAGLAGRNGTAAGLPGGAAGGDVAAEGLRPRPTGRPLPQHI